MKGLLDRLEYWQRQPLSDQQKMYVRVFFRALGQHAPPIERPAPLTIEQAILRWAR